MKTIYSILLVHVVLIILASTDFDIIPFAIKGEHFNWDYWTYSFRNGFGYTFHSRYSLLQILTYIGAYAAGLVLFAAVYHKGFRFPGSLGFGL